MKKLVLSLFLFSAFCFAQTKVTPDCTIPFSFTAAGSTSNSTCGAPNGAPNGNGIASWIVVYYNTGFSGLSVTVQSAPDNAGAPGSWGTFAGTVLTNTQYPGSSGANPNTATTSAFTGLAGYYPWMRVNVSGLTGSGKITGNLYGFYNSTLAKAGSGGGGGITVAGTANQISISPSDPCSTGTCTIFVPTNPVFDGVVTGGGFVSNEAASGNLQLNGFTSGNVTLTVADIAGTAIAYMWPSTNGTAGQVLSDSGVATCPTLPAGAPTVCHQLAWIAAGGGGSGGGGVLGYSGSALTLPTSGTTFLAPVGGALASSTEANVTANAPAAAAISNMYVTMSAAPGTGNSIAFTFRDAGSSTPVTCTISGASATSCQDTTHNFTPTVGDALSVQAVTSGTVIIAPSIKIIAEYGVTGGGGVASVGGLTGVVPGGLILQEQHTATNSTELDFTGCISSTYDEYEIHLVNLLPVTNNVNLLMQMSSNGGSSYDTGANYTRNDLVVLASVSIATESSSLNGIPLQNNSDNTSTWGMSMKVTMPNPGSSALFKSVYGFGSGSDGSAGSRVITWSIGDFYTVTTAVNAFRLIMSSGNIASGTVRCYGIAKQ